MIKKIMIAVLLLLGTLGLTGCTTNDITIISENGRVKINYQDLYTKEEIEKNGSTLEELMKYNCYKEVDTGNGIYYVSNSCPYAGYWISGLSRRYIISDTMFKLDRKDVEQILKRHKSKAICVLTNNTVRVTMPSPIVDTNGQIDPNDNKTVIYNNYQNFDIFYAYTQEGKVLLDIAPTIEIPNKKGGYINREDISKINVKCPSGIKSIKINNTEIYGDNIYDINLNETYYDCVQGPNTIEVTGENDKTVSKTFRYDDEAPDVMLRGFYDLRILEFKDEDSGIQSLKINGKNINLKKKYKNKKYEYEPSAKISKKRRIKK
ncbi:MAG: hypothetical protein PUC12_00770 [Clostridiales bacterium]|nr:hypothetical protein [Clostridiales bacterium]